MLECSFKEFRDRILSSLQSSAATSLPTTSSSSSVSSSSSAAEPPSLAEYYQYLFARQARLALSLQRPLEVLRRGSNFLKVSLFVAQALVLNLMSMSSFCSFCHELCFADICVVALTWWYKTKHFPDGFINACALVVIIIPPCALLVHSRLSGTVAHHAASRGKRQTQLQV